MASRSRKPSAGADQRRPSRSEAPPAPAWAWKRDGLLAVVVAVVALAVFANAVGNNFAYDDLSIIKLNPRLKNPWALGVFFTTSYWDTEQFKPSLYRPLTIMSFAVDHAVFGPGPFGPHLMNVLANAVLGALVYAFLFQLLRRRDVAFMAALLFAIHPVHTEVVANGVGRSELYAGIAMLAAALFHLRFVRIRDMPDRKMGASGIKRASSAGSSKRAAAWPNLVAALLLYFTAMLFKESAAILPGLLFLAEWLVLQRGRLNILPRQLGGCLAYAAPLVVFLIMRARVIGGALPSPQEVMLGISAGQRALHASETLLRYLGQLSFPMRLCAEYSDYTDMVRPTVGDPMVLASLLTWAACAGLIYWMARRGAFVLIFSIAWFFAAILPTSNLLVMIGTVRADRLLFVPSLGFVLGLAWLLARWAHTRWRVAAYIALAVILSFYGWRSITRNRVWRSQEALWTETCRQNPSSAIAWSFVGDFHRDHGDYAKAEKCYLRAIKLRDGAGFFYPEAHNRYAQMVVKRGDRAEAEWHYRLVLDKRPNQTTALLNLGEMLLHRPETRAESIDLLNRYKALKPDDFRVYANLAQAYKVTGRLTEARSAIERAIELAPEEVGLREVLAEIEALEQR